MADPTPADYLARARVFERAARHVVFDGGHPDTFPAVLHLITHALELTLKAILLREGVSTEKLKRAPYGHDIAYMWHLDDVAFLRRSVPAIAAQAAYGARSSGHWVDKITDDPVALFAEQVLRLSKLHSQDTNYALRYPSATNHLAPRAPFLVDVIGCLIDEASKS